MNKKKNKYIFISFYVAGMHLILLSLLLITSCSNESSEVIRKKLDIILSDDLSSIVEDIPKDGLIEEPCYDLVFYKEYSEGNYSQNATAHFYFLKNINKKIVRKYRYYTKNRMWERYLNEYKSSSDTLSNCQKE